MQRLWEKEGLLKTQLINFNICKGEFIMKAMFQVIKYEGDNSNLVYRYPEEDFNTKSKLIVQQSQEAIFYSRGQLADQFTEGTYTLETKNIPIIRGLANLPFGKESPFSAVIYFVNKTEQMNIRWGLKKVSFTEPEFGALLNVGVSGTLSFKIENARIFLGKLVGTKTSFDQNEVMIFLKEFISSHGRTHLANIFNTDSSISIFTVETKMNELANKLYECLADDFEDYGLKLEKFIVTSFAKDEDSEAYKELLKTKQQRLVIEGMKAQGERNVVAADIANQVAIKKKQGDVAIQQMQQDTDARSVIVDSNAQAIKRKQEGYTYQQERGFDVAEKTAENEGAGNFAAAGMGVGVGLGTIGAAAQAVGGLYNDALSNIGSGNASINPQPENTSENNIFSGLNLGLGDEEQKTTQDTPQIQISAEDRLAKIKELYEKGLLTEEKYNQKMDEILSEL